MGHFSRAPKSFGIIRQISSYRESNGFTNSLPIIGRAIFTEKVTMSEQLVDEVEHDGLGRPLCHEIAILGIGATLPVAPLKN
jgi:hypothetical protein